MMIPEEKWDIKINFNTTIKVEEKYYAFTSNVRYIFNINIYIRPTV